MSVIELKTVFLDVDQLDGAIHTTNIKTNDLINIESEKMQKCVRCNVTVAPAITTSCIVNVNNLNGELTSYEDYEQAMTEITNEIGIKEYWTTRVDMKFDSYDEEHYVKYAKLYRLLISMIAVTYNVKNCYRSVDLFTEQQLSVAIKNSEFEIENYDKNRESGGKNPAKSRLELRSKRMKGRSIRQEFLVMWRNRWKNAIKNFDLVGERYNDKLVEIYYRDSEAFPKKFADVTDFLLQYQNYVATNCW